MTQDAPAPGALRFAAARSLERARQRLLELQDPSGCFTGAIHGNAELEAADLLTREILRDVDPARRAATAARLREQMGPQAGWPSHPGGAADLSVSLVAYLALRISGDPADSDHLAPAAQFIRDAGGPGLASPGAREWLAWLGLLPWREVQAPPPEWILLPRSSALGLAGMPPSSRERLVPAALARALGPLHPVDLRVDELWTGERHPPAAHRRHPGLARLVRRIAQHPIPALRRHALALCERWLLRRQAPDGTWSATQPTTVHSLLALFACGYSVDHPALQVGLAGLDRFASEGATRFGVRCVRDTSSSVLALLATGAPVDHPALRRADAWLRSAGRELAHRSRGADRAAPSHPAGAARVSDLSDGTALVRALAGLTDGAPGLDDTVAGDGVARLLASQVRSGGFSREGGPEGSELAEDLEWAEPLGARDPVCALATARALRALGVCREPRAEVAAERARVWLVDRQEGDGSWADGRGHRRIAATGEAILALTEAGQKSTSIPVQRAVRWLEMVQQSDGGFGEAPGQRRDAFRRADGAATASQTGWALAALMCEPDERPSPSAERAAAWLVRRQRDDGWWEEPELTDVFPPDRLVRHDLDRLVVPVEGLARFAGALGGGDTPSRTRSD